jgi:hypothetical protein
VEPKRSGGNLICFIGQPWELPQQLTVSSIPRQRLSLYHCAEFNIHETVTTLFKMGSVSPQCQDLELPHGVSFNFILSLYVTSTSTSSELPDTHTNHLLYLQQSHPRRDLNLISPPTHPHHPATKLVRLITLLCPPRHDVGNRRLCEYISPPSERARCSLLSRNIGCVVFCGFVGHIPGWSAVFVVLCHVGHSIWLDRLWLSLTRFCIVFSYFWFTFLERLPCSILQHLPKQKPNLTAMR